MMFHELFLMVRTFYLSLAETSRLRGRGGERRRRRNRREGELYLEAHGMIFSL